MLPCYVLLDLETTGGQPLHDRITELAVVRVEHGQEVARWSTLVNPGLPISPFIQNLTGISNEMVRDAPAFAALAPRLQTLLEGAVLVAHNVRFDHGFLRHEFERLGLMLRVKTMCTVRLSRLLYPQHRGHGLDALMQRHGLQTDSRHRAMSDVKLLQAWLQIAARELGAEQVQHHALTLLQSSAALPPQLETPLEDIPDAAGVYLFHGTGPQPLYMGHSAMLRSRVQKHFQARSQQESDRQMAQEIRRIEWFETAGALGALLLQARLLKEYGQPVYPQTLQRERSLWAWRLAESPAVRPLLKLVRGEELQPQQFDRLYGSFRSRRQALDSLRELADRHALCPQALGLESGKGPCSAQLQGRCQGPCCGQELPERQYQRLRHALAPQRLPAWPHPGTIGLREHNPQNGRSELHLFDQWCHLASVQDDAGLDEALTHRRPLAFELDIYRWLLKHLALPGQAGVKLIHLA